jgi:hypothetical protein
MEKTDRLYGQLVVDFANAESNDEAFSGYFRNVHRVFGYDFSDTSYSVLEELKKELHDFVEKMRKVGTEFCYRYWLTDLSDMLELIVCSEPLRENQVLKDILFDYSSGSFKNEFHSNWILLEDDDSIVEEPLPRWVEYKVTLEKPIRVEDFHKLMWQDLAHCTIEFLRVKKNREYIKKCANLECQKFFIASRLDERERFCVTSCRMQYHHSKPEYKEKKATKQREKYGWVKRVNDK